MFMPERWAQAFIDACGYENLENGTAALKAINACLLHASGAVFGSVCALQMGEMLRTAGEKAGYHGGDKGMEAARYTFMLLIKKNLIKHLHSIIQEIEKIQAAKNGIITVTVDSVFPLDADYTQVLIARIKEKLAVREINLEMRIVPELLGGCRIRIGSDCWDASLRGQLHKMATNLHIAGGFSW
jgi:F-type H+-transporting ATPase subunit delta